MQRTTLTLRLNRNVQVHAIDCALSGATLVEAHEGIDPDAPPPWPPIDHTDMLGPSKPGVPRTELVSMFEFKGHTAVSNKAAPTVRATLRPRVLGADGADTGRLFLASGLLQLTLLCAWEPLQCLGVESITIYGAHVAPPSKAPSPAPITAPPPLIKKARLEDPSPAAMLPPKRPRAEEEHHFVHPAPCTPSVDSLAAPHAALAPHVYVPAHASPAPPPAPPSDPKPLAGCVIVLSGFVNPMRAELRDKALSLGAAVQNDWGPKATHLVAAMLNTPKVAACRDSGFGWVVAKEWILHAFLAKGRPKELSYRLAGDRPPTSVSEDAPPSAGPTGGGGGGGGGGAFRLVM